MGRDEKAGKADTGTRGCLAEGIHKPHQKCGLPPNSTRPKELLSLNIPASPCPRVSVSVLTPSVSLDPFVGDFGFDFHGHGAQILLTGGAHRGFNSARDFLCFIGIDLNHDLVVNDVDDLR